MTGFGRGESVCGPVKITVDLKSLNSKGLDLNLRLPSRYRDLEYSLRKMIAEQVQRGKVDCYINMELTETAPSTQLNTPLIQQYMSELQPLAPTATGPELLQMAIRMPDALRNTTEELAEEEKSAVEQALHAAIQDFIGFRRTEGASLEKELLRAADSISEALRAVEPYEKGRLEAMQEKYRQAIKDFEVADENRYYQEIAYQAERLDITEEKVRLRQHIQYFGEVLAQPEATGKKLGFIAQEMGREINTLGSKANHAEIQKLVVDMKDELEKIKEQTLNVL